MDHNAQVFSAPHLILFILALLAGPALAEPAWTTQLTTRLAQIDADFPGELGVYVEDLRSGDSAGLRASQRWYLASTVKVAVAIQLLEDVDAGRLRLSDRVALEPLDYVDGAGPTKSRPIGSQVSLRFLLDQMLIHSDNTATDVLLRVVGEARVNALVERLVGPGAGRITTLADVRRHAYSEFDPRAMQLAPNGFFSIRGAGDGDVRVEALAEVLGIPRDRFRAPDLDTAFERYYASGLNSAPLDQYSGIFAALARGEVLSPASGALLLNTLEAVETGQQRIKAGLPAEVSFAHKTGTQHRRACNIGLAIPPGQAATEGVIIAACARGHTQLSEAEAAFRSLGEAVTASGVLD